MTSHVLHLLLFGLFHVVSIITFPIFTSYLFALSIFADCFRGAGLALSIVVREGATAAGEAGTAIA